MIKIRFEMPAEELVLWRFGHGRFADAWILVHIATGVAAGFLGLLIGLPSALFLALSTLGYFLYELWEAWYGIVEGVENVLFDVAAGVLGTATVLWAYSRNLVNGGQLIELFGLSLFVCLFLLFIGWRVYLGRVVRQEVRRLYPAWDTPAGRLKIKKDQYLFFGLAIVSVPLPIIFIYYGLPVVLVWSISMLTAISFIHRQIK